MVAPIKLIVAGSRKFQDEHVFDQYILAYLTEYEDVTIITGMAKGPDRMAYDYAMFHDVPVIEFPANWDLHGRSAGYIRNAEMLKSATHLLAFWDGVSKGTKNMIDIATKAGIHVTVILVTV